MEIYFFGLNVDSDEPLRVDTYRLKHMQSHTMHCFLTFQIVLVNKFIVVGEEQLQQ